MRLVIIANVGFAFIVLDVDLSHLVLGPVIWFALDEFPTYGIVCRRRALKAAKVQSRCVLIGCSCARSKTKTNPKTKAFVCSG